MREILDAIAKLQASGQRGALATVVHVTGSAYRREGAKMLVLDDGTAIGAISGGCLESDVMEAARKVIQTGEPQLLHYDMTADDDVVWGLGLGCNGTVDVFVEALGSDHAQLLSRLDGGERLAVATVQATVAGGPAVGQRLYIYEDRVEGTLGDDAWDRLVAEHARELLEQGKSRTYLYPLREESGTGGSGDGAPGELLAPDTQAVIRRPKDVLAGHPRSARIYIEVIVPPPRLIVFGAGHDAIPVSTMARTAGFNVTVYDSRPAFTTKERFPDADEVICAYPDQVLDKLTFDRFTYVVVMTHNYNHDRDILRQIWGQPYAYLGVLGPWERTGKLLDDLRQAGLDTEAGMDRLYSPIGLNIGAEGPEQIAIAIMAEILAVHKGRPAGFLRFHKGPIHA